MQKPAWERRASQPAEPGEKSFVVVRLSPKLHAESTQKLQFLRTAKLCRVCGLFPGRA